MLQIKKIRANHVLDFAAEELKKYLRMMMPRCGEVEISYDPQAKIGFRLGLLEDFGLPCEGEDPVLDDIVHVDTHCHGGILAGSNPRSVLFAVYRFLRLNGCRWLYPGVDGEHVPVRELQPQYYHKLADHRFRGHCNEGAESQSCMLETIDFYAKQEINVYMLEFDIPFYYYDIYYTHLHNESNRIPEPVSPQQVLQWKRQCEVEISKRGLQFHDMGHGWTAEPFGLSSTSGWHPAEDLVLTDEQQQCLAMLNGVRAPYRGVMLNTNLCMSNPRVRKIMVEGVVSYAEAATNADYLHVWLADERQNHCECAHCRKMRPSDFYMMIMNELDEALTQKNLSTRIVFIAYVDTLFAPEQIRITNPKRFSLMYAPIFRSYSSSITASTIIPEPTPYVRNHWPQPKDAAENLALLRQWQKIWHGTTFCYEYHYWRAQYSDPGILYIARRIYEDIMSLKLMGLDGYVEDGSQRSFFPNGFHIYIYAEALMDRNCDYDAILRDYFRHIYGEDWEQVRDYLSAVSEAFDFAYMSGERSADPSQDKYYNPAMVDALKKVKELAEQGRKLAQTHRVMPTRPQTISYRLLERHAEYIEGVAGFMIEKARGNYELAEELSKIFFQSFGRHEYEIERYYDHGMACEALKLLAGKSRI